MVGTLPFRLCGNVTTPLTTVMLLPLATHQPLIVDTTEVSRLLQTPTTTLTTPLLMLAGIAADTDRTNELNDSGEETIIKSQLDTDSVINLSNITFSHDETQLLARGLSFCPMPQQINWNEVRANINNFSRRISTTFLLKLISTLSTSRALGHLLNTGTHHQYRRFHKCSRT